MIIRTLVTRLLVDPGERLIKVKSWWPSFDRNGIWWPTILMETRAGQRQTSTRLWNRAHLAVLWERITNRRTLVTLAVIAFLATGGAAWAGDLPDASRTPGAINPAVTQDNIATTICKSGWTKTIRPPVSYTNKLKAAQMAQLGMTDPPRLMEEDHRVPLECGGDPTDPRNLSPERWTGDYGAHSKDALETHEKHAVCTGKITLDQCRAVFLAPHDWRDDYDVLFKSKGARDNSPP